MLKLQLKRCIKFVKYLHVEPILFLSFLSLNSSHIVESVGLYGTVCLQTFSNNPQIDCDHLSNSSVMIDGKSAEIIVQQSMAKWTMAIGIAGTAPALISDLLLGAYSDRHGRKVNILLGVTGTMIVMYALIVLFTFPNIVPIYTLVIVQFLSALTGSNSIIRISSMAYLADTSLDKSGLTSRMSIIPICVSAATIIGPFIAAATSRALTKGQTILISQSMLVIAFAYCMWRIGHIPPAQMSLILMEKEKKKHGRTRPVKNEVSAGQEMQLEEKAGPGSKWKSAQSGSSPNGPVPNRNSQSIFASVFSLLKDTWVAFTKRREGNVRLYLIIASLVIFLDVLSHVGIRNNIFPLYAQKAPLGWNQSTLGYYRSIQGVMILIGSIFGIILFQKILHFTDTFIILIGILSHIGETLILAFSTQTWLVYVAAALGSMGQLSPPCIHAFVAKQVDPDDVGKAYTAFGISATIANLISSALLNTIYYATVGFLAGFVFLVAAGIQTLAFSALIWLHLDSSRVKREEEIGIGKRLVKSIFEREENEKEG